MGGFDHREKTGGSVKLNCKINDIHPSLDCRENPFCMFRQAKPDSGGVQKDCNGKREKLPKKYK